MPFTIALRRIDHLRRLRVVLPLLDQVGHLPNLGFRGKHQVDVLLDLALDRIEGDDAGLADPGADVPRNLDPAAALGDDLESSLGGEHLPQAADLGDGLQFGD
ncbi:hypothetical protein ACVWZ3_004409 [Bradyrhizobium sp. i1.3.6]